MNGNIPPSHAALLGMHQGMQGRGHPLYGMPGMAPHPGMMPPHLGGGGHPYAGRPHPMQHHQGLSSLAASQAMHHGSLNQFPTSMSSKVSSSVNEASSGYNQNPHLSSRAPQHGSFPFKPPSSLPYSSEATSTVDSSSGPRKSNTSSNPTNPFLDLPGRPNTDSVTSSRQPSDRPAFNGITHQDQHNILNRSPNSSTPTDKSPARISSNPHKENSPSGPVSSHSTAHQNMRGSVMQGDSSPQFNSHPKSSAPTNRTSEEKQAYAWKMQQFMQSQGKPSLGDSDIEEEDDYDSEEDYQYNTAGAAVNKLVSNSSISIEPQNRGARQSDTQNSDSSSLTKKLMMNGSISIAPQGISNSESSPRSSKANGNDLNSFTKSQLSIYEQLRARGVSVEVTQVPIDDDEYSDE